MSKKLLYILIILCSLCAQSCKRYVCPAYFSAYNIEPKAPKEFFNYFDPDTAKTPVVLKDTIPNSHRLLQFEKGEEPNQNKLFESKGQDKNGLVNSKKSPLDLIFPNRKANFMKHVKAEITITELDSLEALEMYAVTDSLFDPNRFKRDQYVYMQLFGFAILDSLDSLRGLREEEEAAAAADTVGANMSKKERRKLRKEERKKRRRLRKEGLSTEDKEAGTDEKEEGDTGRRKTKRIKEKPSLSGKKEKKEGGLLKGKKDKKEKEDKKKKADDDDGGG